MFFFFPNDNRCERQNSLTVSSHIGTATNSHNSCDEDGFVTVLAINKARSRDHLEMNDPNSSLGSDPSSNPNSKPRRSRHEIEGRMIVNERHKNSTRHPHNNSSSSNNNSSFNNSNRTSNSLQQKGECFIGTKTSPNNYEDLRMTKEEEIKNGDDSIKCCRACNFVWLNT